MSTAWKSFELKVCRALGCGRRGQLGPYGWASGSDDDGTGPFSVECKRVTRYQLRRAWIEQARRDSKHAGKPWVLVVGEHNDRRPVAVVDFWALVEVAQQAGLIEPSVEQ